MYACGPHLLFVESPPAASGVYLYDRLTGLLVASRTSATRSSNLCDDGYASDWQLQPPGFIFPPSSDCTRLADQVVSSPDTPSPAETARYRARVNAECAARAGSFASWITTPPAPDDPCAMYDLCAFGVRLDSGAVALMPFGIRVDDEEPTISKERPPFREPTWRDCPSTEPDPRHPCPFIGSRRWSKLADGSWLGSYYAGEFGSSLWWFSANGTSRELLPAAYVTDMIDVGGEKWLTVGYVHLQDWGGAVLRAERTGDRWHLVPVAKFEQSAEVAIADGPSSAMVVTSSQLWHVSPAGTAKVHEGSWRAGANSIVVEQSGRILLGTGHAVIRLEPQGGRYVESWLVSPSCHASYPESCRCSVK